ncbi:MAG: M28 family peptidase [Raineya sp.]|nr:M28 family peptidase [Raineya sp.]MDW8295861.1 M28 family peptidase [Raineya sp.]
MLAKRIICFFILVSLACSCNNPENPPKQDNTENSTTSPQNTKPLIKAPEFNADSAFAFVERQVSFGPRIPNSEAHRKCADYLVQTLQRLGASTQIQEFQATSFDKKTWNGKNIIGSINPQATKRILLAAHWDSRRFSDKEKDTTLHKKPIDGADDGASGVAVILEILRTIQNAPEKPQVGIDVIFFDLEDDGTPENYKEEDHSNATWCLGSQYWSKNKHQPNYSAYFGILLDMVGAKGAKFYHEPFSLQYAESIVQEVWQTAQRLGFANYFINQRMPSQGGGGIMDDHFYVNRDGKIPMIDIINYENSFPAHHHTQADNLQIIDKNTLKAVGQTLLQVLYNQTLQ